MNRSTDDGPGATGARDAPLDLDRPIGGPPVEPSQTIRVLLLGGLLAVAAYYWGAMSLLVIAVVVVSIFLHEMGHYLVARWSGMKSSEFFIGFGPKIWSFTRGETEYGIKAVPAGAYVRIIGMNNLEEVDPGDEERSFRRKSYPRRFAVAFAGPAMNFVFAFVLLAILAMTAGIFEEPAWPRVDPAPGSAADAAGLAPGDELISVAGHPVASFDDFSTLIRSIPGDEVEIRYLSDGEVVTTTAVVGERVAGISGSAWPEVHVQPGSAAWDARLAGGDVIVAVAGEEAPTTFEGFVALLTAAEGPLEVSVDRDGSLYRASLPPATTSLGFFGVAAYRPPPQPTGPVEAVGDAAHWTGTLMWRFTEGLGQFFFGGGIQGMVDQVASTPPSGPETAIGPSAATTDPAISGLPELPDPESVSEDRVLSILGIIRLGSQLGWQDMLVIMASVNIFLGLFNLIPLLPFDGGHLAVASYERVREGLHRRRVLGASLVEGRYMADFAKLLPVTYAVVVAFILLGVAALYLDAVAPVTAN